MRATLPTFALVVALLLPGPALALGIVVADVQSTGASSTTLSPGERITFGLRLENPNQLEMIGIGIVAFGYDPALSFVSGASNASVFNVVNINGTPVGGIANVVPPYEGIYTQGSSGPEPGETVGPYVRAYGAISLMPSSGDGLLDLGVDGSPVAAGDVHIRLTFEARLLTGPGGITLHFGVGDPTLSGDVPNYGEVAITRGGVVPFQNATHTLSVITNPEPGTAGLLGVGLIGLASRRRR